MMTLKEYYENVKPQVMKEIEKAEKIIVDLEEFEIQQDTLYFAKGQIYAYKQCLEGIEIDLGIDKEVRTDEK